MIKEQNIKMYMNKKFNKKFIFLLNFFCVFDRISLDNKTKMEAQKWRKKENIKKEKKMKV